MIVKELLSNLAIVTSAIFLYTQLTNSMELNRASNPIRKVLIGILGGLFSNILMLFGMHFGTTIIDLRHIPIVLLAYYGGPVPALITMALSIIGRFIIGINTSSYLAVILVVSITLFSIILSNMKLHNKAKVFSLLTFSNVIFSILVTLLLKDFQTLVQLIPLYWIISYLAGFMSFYIVEYLRNSQKLFNRYKSESATDSLTGLNNVRKFDEIFNNVLTEFKHKNEKLSLLYIDIDFFKKINDSYGHKEGDVILYELGKILKNSTRSFDIVSRNGGEEFTVILLDCGLIRAAEIGEELRRTVENHNFILTTGDYINITVSIGISCFNETTDNSSVLIEEADKALYQAKRSGRNRVCLAEKDYEYVCNSL